jgi:copper chaperone CopZ
MRLCGTLDSRGAHHDEEVTDPNVTQAHHFDRKTPELDAVATVLHSGRVHLASEKAVVERALGAQPGVARVECNPVAQTTTVVYDPGRTSVAQLQTCIQACGYECAGESIPTNLGAVRWVDLGSLSAQAPQQIRTCPIRASGSSDYGFAV